MQDLAKLIDVANENSFRADLICSLAAAADLVIRCESLTDRNEARRIGLHVVESIKIISEQMKNNMDQLGDEKENRFHQIRRERGLC
jgi:hypothetical protein